LADDLTPATRSRAPRLDPEVRRQMILDTAASLVMSQGISGCSLDAVAAASGVSKALVYKYFANRDALLSALIRREFEYMMGHDEEATGEAQASLSGPEQTMDEVLRLGVARYVQYLVERGGLFRALVSDAGLASQIRSEVRAGQIANINFWRDRTIKAYGLPFDLARIGSIMASHALEGAQNSVRDGKIEIDRLADFWTTFVQAGWKAVGEKYGEPPRKH